MNKKYRVVFVGLLESEDYFKKGMSRLGVSEEIVEKIINRAPVVLKQDMPLGGARQYADAIQMAGGRVNIQENGFYEEKREKRGSISIEPLDHFTMCPQCGQKQLKRDICNKCGFIFSQG